MFPVCFHQTIPWLVKRMEVNEVFDNLFVDKERQNLLVDVDEIFESLLSVQESVKVLFVVGKVPD